MFGEWAYNAVTVVEAVAGVVVIVVVAVVLQHNNHNCCYDNSVPKSPFCSKGNH